MEIKPTHTCFDDALDIMAEIVKNSQDIENFDHYSIAHSLCKPDGDIVDSSGKVLSDGVIAHAWIERRCEDGGHACIFQMLINGKRETVAADKEEFYQHFKPFDITLYTIKQASELNFKTGHYAPWVDRYKKHCGDYEEQQ